MEDKSGSGGGEQMESAAEVPKEGDNKAQLALEASLRLHTASAQPATLQDMMAMFRSFETNMTAKMEKQTQEIMRAQEDVMEERLAKVKEEMVAEIQEVDDRVDALSDKLGDVELQTVNDKADAEDRMWKIEKQQEEMMLRLPIATLWPTKEKSWEGAWTEIPKKGKGKSKGKEATKSEEMARTVTVGSYGDATTSEEIVRHLTTLTEKMDEEVDEIFAFGRKYAERGAIRFKTEEHMWEYMMKFKGQHRHLWKEGRASVYLSVAKRDEEDSKMTKAMRKATRAVIETMPGTAEATKEELTTNYKTGFLKHGGVLWAQWSEEDGKLNWKEGVEEAKRAAGRYEELMR
jgi:hypothetical protein